ncbi:MAG TPA: ABC transporter permease [Chthoniobacteraceae bacterium]|jgi:ABC-2 type transport system permease protein|nr:ABC transporter permease [Chthoniobacteraceae bacterium]
MALNPTGRAPSFLPQVAAELHKTFAQPRTWAGFGILAVMAAMLFLLCSLEPVRDLLSRSVSQLGCDPARYLTGLTYALLALRATMLLIGALFIALVAGESVAREVDDGSMRMLLCRPVSRFRVLAVKAVAALIHTFLLTGFLGFVALGLGLLFHRAGGMLAFDPLEKLDAIYDFLPGLARYFLAVLLLALSLSSVTAAAFALSCFNLRPAAAAVGALSPFFMDYVLRRLPFFSSIQSYFLTAKMGVWLQVFQPAIPWYRLLNDYTLLLALDASLFVIAWAHFERRDLKP